MRLEWLRAFARESIAVLVLCGGAAGVRAADVRPIAGENVNMVSGVSWPGGDPFLQRQNEPSIAVSTANPSHLLAGANDYRTVDLPFPDAPEKMVGDAWLGLFKSFDGGRTWGSVLLAGYPQDPGCAGAAPSPLCGLAAAADPVVRAGTEGTFFYSGIAFDRGTNVGKVFVARFLDLNDKENGDPTAPLPTDPIRYVGTVAIDRGAAGQFLDKPWIAVDEPRAGAARCTIPVAAPDGTATARSLDAGNVYIAYAMFTGTSESVSKILFARSTDCGATWSLPQKISESQHVNQGTSVAIDPLSGAVYVVWRRFAAASQADAIVLVKSVDAGRTFSKPVVLATIPFPFDQFASGAAGATLTRFRTQTMPTIAVSVDGSGATPVTRVHVAWSQRPTADGPGRIVMSTSEDGGVTWPAPSAVDDVNDVDAADACVLRPSRFERRGHQLMPSLTFGQGRLVLVYYDTSFDHTRRYFEPTDPFAPAPGGCGRFYREKLARRGELLGGTGAVFGPFIDDAGLTEVRHTMDVRVGSAAPGATPIFATAPASRYRFGARGDERPPAGGGPLAVPGFDGSPLEIVSASGELRLLQELQVNPPNLPLFKQGTAPFMGDYLDVQGLAFVREGGRWATNLRPSTAPVFHAVWTSNQDVRAPADGDWKNYTPAGQGGASRFDPTRNVPACVPGQEGMRNQNIYTARITEGLLVTSPQNAKPLSQSVTRAFVVLAQNTTGATMRVRLAASPPPGVAGLGLSFTNDGQEVLQLEADVAPHSSIHRSVFARLAPERCASGGACADLATPISVVVDELCAAAPCRSGAVTLNGPGTPESLVDPDGAVGVPIAQQERYGAVVVDPNISNPNISNPNISNRPVHNPNISNPNISNPNISNPNISNPNISNPNVAANADLANVSNPNISNPNISNPNISNPNISNPNISNPNISNAPVSDLNYRVVNEGNTTASYHVKVVSSAATPPSPLQLIVTRTYYTPVAQDCALLEQPNPELVVNVPDVSGALATPDDLADPDLSSATSDEVTNATIALAPGEEVVVTLRGAVDLATMARFGAATRPAIVPHAGVAPDTRYRSLLPTIGTRTTLAFDATTRLFTARVFRLEAPAGTPPPAGTVAFLVNGEPILAPVPADGVVLLDGTSLDAGTRVLAYYGGDAIHRASESSPVQVRLAGRWMTLPPLAQARGAPMAAVAAGRLFAIGGYAAGATPLASVELYDPATASWRASTPMPTARGGAAVAVAGGRIYVMGGNGTTLYLDAVEALDPTGEIWTPTTPMPAGRYDGAAAAVGPDIYVFGGLVRTGTGGSERGGVLRYDTATETWTARAGAGCTWRRALAAVEWNGLVYLVGGLDDFTGDVKAVEVYDPATDACTSAGPSAEMAGIGGGAAAADGKIYFAGGFISGTVPRASSLEIYDIATGTWTDGEPMAVPRQYLAVTTDGGTVYAVAGYDFGVATSAVVEAFTP